MTIGPSPSKFPSHNRYPYSVIDRRPDYAWPGEKRLAFYICISVEHFAFGAGVGEDLSTVGAPQGQRNFGWRDYGQRVGLWRLVSLCDELKLRPAFAINSLIYAHRPEIIERLAGRGDEIIAHGRTSSELQRGMWEADEAWIIRHVTDTIARREGAPPKGWLGPGFSETGLTPDLLKEAGYGYLLDWPADDQPFWMRTRGGPILSVPYPLELNDVTAILHRHHSAREFADMIVNQFDVMIEQCCTRPLVFALAIHPYVMGQPFRLHALRNALKHCVEHRHRDRVWMTQPGAIAEYCSRLAPGIVPGSETDS